MSFTRLVWFGASRGAKHPRSIFRTLQLSSFVVPCSTTLREELSEDDEEEEKELAD